MDESKPGVDTAVSCLLLGWYFDLCAEKDLNINQVVRHLDYSREHLQSPENFVDWHTFTTMSEAVLHLVPEFEFVEHAAAVWQRVELEVLTTAIRTSNDIYEQFNAIFGQNGLVPRLFPFRTRLEQVSRRRFRIVISTQYNLDPDRSVFLFMKGLIQGLPVALYGHTAGIDMTVEHNAAIYDVRLSYQPTGLLRRIISSLWTRRQTMAAANTLFYKTLQLYRELELARRKTTDLASRSAGQEMEFQLLAQNVTDIIWTADLNLNLLYYSPSFLTLTGFTDDEAKHMAIEDLFSADRVDNFRDFFQRSLRGETDVEQGFSFRDCVQRKDGSKLWLDVNARFIPDKNGKPEYIVGTARDISEQKQYETLLEHKEQSFQAITTSAREAIITFSGTGMITFANPAAINLFSLPPANVRPVSIKEIIPGVYHVSPAELDDLSPDHFSLDGVTMNGEDLVLQVSLSRYEEFGKTNYTCIARDLTQTLKEEADREALEAQLLSIQKMESLGQLTGGIAHDFNNLLVAINGFTDLAMNTADPAQKDQYLSEVRIAGQRASDITQKLLAFSRQQAIEPIVVDLCQLVQETRSLLERLIPESIQIVLDIKAGSLPVLLDPGQAEQLIMNLAVNARDATPQGGVITIQCTRLEPDLLEGFNNPDTLIEHAVIKVSDTGTGMSQESVERVFEPFYTTKPEGSGTGLGMAVVYGIVNQHQGEITVNSQLGVGTTFTMKFPLTNQVNLILQDSEEDTAAHGETILIIEDDQQVCSLAEVTLKNCGYQVLTARNGEEGINQYLNFANDVDLVISDVVMPRVSGRQVWETIHAHNPSVKMIFTSGYSTRGLHTRFIVDNDLEFISKPFHAQLLRRKVKSALST